MQGQNNQTNPTGHANGHQQRHSERSTGIEHQQGGERQPEVRVSFKVRPTAEENISRRSLRSEDITSDDESQVSVHSDNISTIPLKLIVSHTSTNNSPSILSGEQHHDGSSFIASTTDTSLAPSPHASVSPSFLTGLSTTRWDRGERDRERDSESIITLASSSRAVRRRSLDTNCSLAGIPPASVMERLSLNPSVRDPTHEEDE